MSTENLEGNNASKRRNSGDVFDGDTPGKRGRFDDDSTFDPIQNETPLPVSTKQLSHNDYTIGWICALSLEMAAARAMLDEEHKALPIPTSDHNVYTLGSISGHHVVIACLPSGVYGLTSATAVGLSMRGTFPNSVNMPLMVGIGGGVPSGTHDIRLGDVVVSHPSPGQPAVKQYDYGKTTDNGVLECKGTLNKPAHGLLNAVASLRAQHDLYPSQVPSNIDTALRRYDLVHYRYPGATEDVLHEAECEHTLEASMCEACGPPKEITRPSRQSISPVIHYGSIASGNQVIKHAKTRDRLARQHDVLCFEMEAAGLMDHLPCLVIRGISDYCDSFKHKQFQGYAALAAAAYAKELLSIIPVKQSNISTEVPVQSNDQISEHCKSIMEALNVEEAETRRDTVKNAHSQTCNWILDRPEYTQWLDSDKFYDHRGLLWIKGKPAIGKSTMIKHVLKHFEKQRSNNLLVISFFFNARGHDLEKSTLGMYRSLLFQLLSQAKDLQLLLHDIKSNIVFDQNDLNVLVRLFKKVLGQLQSRKLVCFIDALDECPEDQIREMLETFVQATDVHFLLCFSSRHYPNITVDAGIQLILEDQDGHSQDLTNYINSEFKIGKNKRAESLKKAIFQKSNGIFLWVVLVIGILRKENDRGRVHNMERRLDEIPVGLNDLFRDIILRHGDNLAELVSCIQLVLHAQRPLRREEFYFALLSMHYEGDLEPWDSEEISTKTMSNYIIDCSKGLAELTRGSKPTVQFIHESVREFLLKSDTLIDLYPGFRDSAEGTSHQRLKECCHQWISAPAVKAFFLPYLSGQLGPPSSTEATLVREKAKSMFPFLGYVAQSVLYHAEQAQRVQIHQHDFLYTFPWQYWRIVYNVLQRFEIDQLNYPSELLCFPFCLARFNLQNLLQLWWNQSPSDGSFPETMEILGPNLDWTRFTALYKAKFDTVKTLSDAHMEQIKILFTFWKYVLEDPSMRRAPQYILEVILIWGNDLSKGAPQACIETIMVEAARRKEATVMQLILDHYEFSEFELRDILVEVLQPLYLRPLNIKKTSVANDPDDAFSYSNITDKTITCISILMDHRALLTDHQNDMKSRTMGRTPSGDELALVLAVRWPDVSVVRFLLNKQPSYDLEILNNAFRVAILIGKLEAAELLLQRGAQVNIQDAEGNTLLHDIALLGSRAGIPLLLKSGVDINSRNRYNETPLHAAASTNLTGSLVTLVEQGAQVNLKNNEGKTVLHILAESSFSKDLQSEKHAIDLLVQEGIDLEATDNCGRTPMHLVLYYVNRFDDRAVGRALFEHGAKVSLGPRTIERDDEWDWMCKFAYKIRSVGRWLSLQDLEIDDHPPKHMQSLQEYQMLLNQHERRHRLMIARGQV